MGMAGHEIDRTPRQTKHPAEVVNCAKERRQIEAIRRVLRGDRTRARMETFWKPQTAWKPSNPAGP
jgi:hypothetical protein